MTARDLHRRSDEHAAAHQGRDVAVSAWEEERYRRFFVTSPVGLSRESAGGDLIEVNPSLVELLGRSDATELLGKSADLLFVDSDQATAGRSKLLREGELEPRDVQVARADGTTVWVEHHAVLLPVPGTGQTEILRTFVDIQDRRERERGLQELAYHDGLTGIANRRLLEIRAEQTLALARRRGIRAALVFLDLVDFKLVNDRMGHGAGDELLRQLARRLAAELRTADTLARMGGDEFAILLSEVEGREAAVATTTRLLDRLAAPLTIDGQEVVVESRAGLAIHPDDGDNLSELLARADRALIRAKSGTRKVVGEID